jgi:ferredoxin
MTITYDPKHPKYLDEADVRDELTRAYDICQDCRQCVSLCPSFPTLFSFVDRHDDRDAGRLTPEQQDRVGDAISVPLTARLPLRCMNEHLIFHD